MLQTPMRLEIDAYCTQSTKKCVFSPNKNNGEEPQNTRYETLSHWVFTQKIAVSFTSKGWVATQLSEIFWVANLKVVQREEEMSKTTSQLIIYKEKN